MDNITIQINSGKTVNSTISDGYLDLNFKRNTNKITEFNVNTIINSIDVFDIEREENAVYRIHGSIDYLSILNGLTLNYETLDDFFTNDKSTDLYTIKSIYNSFDFYLLRPATGYTKIGDSSDHITYIKNYEVVATPNNFDLLHAGYSKNIYNEQKYLFNFNIDFNVSSYLDGFGFPITDLYLYYVYKPHNNGNADSETIKMTKWDETTKTRYYEDFTPQLLNIGDIVYGDKIEYSKYFLDEALIDEQIFYIDTPYNDGITKILEWKYKPLIPFKLRCYNDQIKRYNISGSTYDEIAQIPFYAVDLGGGNMIWREILPQGYIDPLTGIGVDYPFINKRRYLYDNVLLSISPNLEHSNTYDVFKEINFNTATNLNYKPIIDNNELNANEPC